jgi:hypothetical protein
MTVAVYDVVHPVTQLQNEPEDSLYKFACLAAAWGVKRERELWMDAVNKRKTKY